MSTQRTCPNYLKDYAGLWEKNPKQANITWFQNAKWGLFIHYGLYSQLERGEWVMFHEKIPIEKYEKLFDSFSPTGFDADFITDLALAAEMKYVNITSCHHEGFCLWKSDTEAYNSYNAYRRDLVRELAECCDRKGLGFFTYYTHILNWRHPYSPTREVLHMGRPDYNFNECRYVLTKPDEFTVYWEYAWDCISELLGLEFPLAGMWLDLIAAYYLRPDLIPIEKTYTLITGKRPETLISFKQGATGTEDFASPEFHFRSQGDNYRKSGNYQAAALADKAWERNKSKHNEICMTLQRQGWGYNKGSRHLDADEVWQALGHALSNSCNLLANTGPLPDGSIHPEDSASLREIGERIRVCGWPGKDNASNPGRALEKLDSKTAESAE